MTLQPAEIREAQARALLTAYERICVVDHKHPNYGADSRKGAIHAWDHNYGYLGRFRTHARAIEAGAVVTKTAGMYFDWMKNESE